ncbi:M56 family metallopeptidase [Actinospica sp.]|uniref:M56 family metallopeptidase n=1 Tax=Actinospica sp. TaxID=1872142 RepID=UPI002BA9C1B8|nr:M56 family metallopeptidase [Actinospica sp.]HWG26805.1 M56 family metallopeptidase [Actinospica sp.]
MITAIALLCYALTVVLVMPRLLPRLWPADRAPRSKIALLLILSWSLPLAAVAAGLALSVRVLAALIQSGADTDNCADRLPVDHSSPIGPIVGACGIAVASAVALRLGYFIFTTYLAARLSSRHHAAALGLCGRTDRALEATVIEHERAASYCLPGRRGRVVVTSQMIRLLSSAQLGAVLAHERAHQRGRHHLLLGLVGALRRAFPWIRMLRCTEKEVRRLVELLADDAAARDHGRLAVASALTVIGTGHVPGGALGVRGLQESEALGRITRMANPVTRMDWRRAALAAATVTATIVLPFALATCSIAVLLHQCPPPLD